MGKYKQPTFRKLLFIFVALSTIMTFTWVRPISANGPGPNFKPNRVLVISGIQMRDNYVINAASDFGDVVALLKLWGIPFDTMRLDIHALSINDFIDLSGHAKYSTIIWTARQDQYPWQAQNYNVLSQAVNNYHISLIALGDRILEPVIQGLVGLSYNGWTTISDPFVVSLTSHFVIRGLEGTNVLASEAFTTGGALVTVVGGDVTTLATAGTLAQLTVRVVDPVSWTKAVWIGGDPGNVYRISPTFITLLKRSIVWTQGYAIYKDYGHSLVLRMDDPGAAQSAYLDSWHNPQLSQSNIQSNIIAPLQAHNAKLDVTAVPGYPWIPDHSIIHSGTVNFIDPFGNTQNIVSTYVGLHDGINASVIEVQSHGLTHQVPDLDTPIGGSTNWWDGTTLGEWANVDWYREFYDTRRNQAVDSATQLARLQQSSDWILQDFGTRPLAFVAPGYLISGDLFVSSQLYTSNAITITLTGAQDHNFTYLTWWGAVPNGPWSQLGTINTDSSGNGQAVYTTSLGAGGSNWYFVVNNASGTQFIGGPVTVNGNFSFALRDDPAMSAQEHLWFPGAGESLTQGSVVGAYRYAYTPPHKATYYTYTLAAQTGYGLANDASSYYLGTDYVIGLPVCVTGEHELAGNFARGVPAVFDFHDRDIALDANFLSNWLNSIDAAYPGVHYIYMNEWSAYMHAQVGASAPTAGRMDLSFTYDSYYSRYFSNHTSTWTLHLADETLADLRNLGDTMDVIVDGVVVNTIDPDLYFNETQSLTVPSGAGPHSIIFNAQGPTPVMVSSFTGKVFLNNVRLDWETATEVGVVGFNVYRSDSQDGIKQKLNSDILPAHNAGQMIGTSYQFNDTVQQGQHYHYWLELVTIDANQMIDPVVLDPNYWTVLPTIRR